MALKTLKDVNVKDKVVLYRAPYDIEVIDGKLEDTKRIDFTIPTLNYLISQNCKIIILTYVGRPDGKVVEDLKTDTHAKYLSEKLNIEVKKIDDCIGAKVETAIKNMKAGELIMLENVRFYNQETEDNNDFAKKLCEFVDIVVFDAFPQAHRKHASTTGILRNKESVVGFYFEKECTQIERVVKDIKRPFVSIIGGAKVSDKVLAIKKLIQHSDLVLVGGGIANAFLLQQGFNIADSYVEDVFVDGASSKHVDIKTIISDILSDEKPSDSVIQLNVEGIGKSNIVLPLDFVVEMNGSNVVLKIDELKDNVAFKIKDIGPSTVDFFVDILTKANSIFWNGPVGVFEEQAFSTGSVSIMNFMKDFKGMGLIAGGDSIALIDKFDDISNFDFISLAGGATLDVISGGELAVMPYLIK